jgi:hypothetical protein
MTASSAAKCSIKQFNIHPKSYSRFVVVKYICPDSQKTVSRSLLSISPAYGSQ